ncbi:hypothetical protein AAVH_09276 [Aphelenchoides avenae]|nr:hypothetical protein AAVH_09276 [Aphelenchus avenae]
MSDRAKNRLSMLIRPGPEPDDKELLFGVTTRQWLQLLNGILAALILLCIILGFVGNRGMVAGPTILLLLWHAWLFAIVLYFRQSLHYLVFIVTYALFMLGITIAAIAWFSLTPNSHNRYTVISAWFAFHIFAAALAALLLFLTARAFLYQKAAEVQVVHRINTTRHLEPRVKVKAGLSDLSPVPQCSVVVEKEEPQEALEAKLTTVLNDSSHQSVSLHAAHVSTLHPHCESTSSHQQPANPLAKEESAHQTHTARQEHLPKVEHIHRIEVHAEHEETLHVLRSHSTHYEGDGGTEKVHTHHTYDTVPEVPEEQEEHAAHMRAVPSSSSLDNEKQSGSVEDLPPSAVANDESGNEDEPHPQGHYLQHSPVKYVTVVDVNYEAAHSDEIPSAREENGYTSSREGGPSRSAPTSSSSDASDQNGQSSQKRHSSIGTDSNTKSTEGGRPKSCSQSSTETKGLSGDNSGTKAVD